MTPPREKQKKMDIMEHLVLCRYLKHCPEREKWLNNLWRSGRIIGSESETGEFCGV